MAQGSARRFVSELLPYLRRSSVSQSVRGPVGQLLVGVASAFPYNLSGLGNGILYRPAVAVPVVAVAGMFLGLILDISAGPVALRRRRLSLLRDLEGTRTLNLRIDSPKLRFVSAC